MRLLPRDRDLGWAPYAWLVYLSVYVLTPLVLVRARGGLVLQAAGLLLFLPLYFAGFWVEGSRRVWIIAAITAIGVATTWANPGGAVFFVYAASFVGGALAGRRAAAAVVAITLVGLGAAWQTGAFAPFTLLFVGVFAPLIGFLNLHTADVRRRDASLRLAHDEIARLARLAERDRIASDLHDLLGHTLSVIVLKADLASKLMDRDPSRAAQEVREVAQVSREALSEVRQAVQGFRTTTFADELSRATSVLRTAGIEVHPDVTAAFAEANGPGGTAAERALALVLREAVTNVLRHARATRCTIALRDEGGSLTLIVHDNGAGGEVREGSGWTGMRRRMEAAGGTLTRTIDRGLRLTATVPRTDPGGARA